MNEHDPIEERRIEELIAELAPEGGVSDGEDEERRTLRDLVGLLPYGLEPRAPSAALRGRLLDRIEGAGMRLPAAAPRVGSPGLRWALPLAATLAIALAGVAGWQTTRLASQGQQVASLEREVAEARRVERELSESRAMLAERQDQLAMLTEHGAEFCVLRPFGEQPQFPKARATMVVAADHDRWFLRGVRLDPCELGRAYKIWFETTSGPVPGPSFRVDGPNADIEVYAEGVPEDMVGVYVTLEHDPNCESPEGPQVLRAERPMKLL